MPRSAQTTLPARSQTGRWLFRPAPLFALAGALLFAGSVVADNEAQATSPLLRPSARLLFKQPDLLRPGQCVRYREGGAGWVMTDPTFHITGVVLGSRIEARRLGTCPQVPGKNPEQYSREEFIRHARAFPCLAPGETEVQADVGLVRLRVEQWDTPHAKRAANQGRLYRGQFLDQPLSRGSEIELEADLLESCSN